MVLLGVASVALSYATMIALGFGEYAAALTGTLMTFDNALTVHSRLILLDMILIFFINVAIYAWVKFRQGRARPFGPAWIAWLLLTGVGIGCASSVKMVGLLTVSAIGIATLYDLWELADRKRGNTELCLAKHFIWRTIGLIILPVAIYIACYYVHFAVLNRTGPGDVYMSAEFQATLEGNTMSQKARKVHFGQTIRLKSRLENVYLHTHLHNYPKVHDDGKVSSEGQQVTGYAHADMNNLWKILPGDWNSTELDGSEISSGSRVRLYSAATGKFLYTHDVASPLTRTNMEISAKELDPDSASQTELDNAIWIIELDGNNKQSQVLRSQASNVRIRNAVHKVCLNNHQKALPKWGFTQREINGDKRGVDMSSLWIIWDIVEPMSAEEEKQLNTSVKRSLSFIEKVIELSKAQVIHNAGLVDSHPFRSYPFNWPFVTRGVSYWTKGGGDARIYFLGNPISWYACILGLGAWSLAAIKQTYFIRRGYTQYDGNQYDRRFLHRSTYLFGCWLLHYIPFFTMSRTLYLHHYLPAYIMSAMVTGAIFDACQLRLGPKYRYLATILFTILVTCIVISFFYFAPLTYGTHCPSDLLESKRWAKSWDWS